MQREAVNLTPRERQVLECRSRGLTNEQAAEALDISINTLRVYRKRIMIKTGCKNSFQLGAWTARNLQSNEAGTTA